MADSAYGLWLLAILDTALFVRVRAELFRPRTERGWRVMSAATPDDQWPPGRTKDKELP